MPDLDRRVAGLRCRDVLGLLADYVDGELDKEQSEQVEAHLRGCDHCERFGGAYGALVASLRRRLGADEPDSDVRTRLADRMREEWTSR